MVDANLNLLPVANPYFARSDYVYNVGWNDSGMPATVNYDNTVTGCNGPIYRNSHITYAGVTDGLSNTVVAGERTPYLSDATWVGIIPGYRHFAYNAFASLGTGGLGVNYDYANAILAAHSGPSLYEDPVVIHPPNSPLGHTDEMYALHPGGANVLMGDGSVRFIKQSINLLDLGGLEQPQQRGGDRCATRIERDPADRRRPPTPEPAGPRRQARSSIIAAWSWPSPAARRAVRAAS